VLIDYVRPTNLRVGLMTWFVFIIVASGLWFVKAIITAGIGG
jgi:succinate dehydrogenase / fumarate reductase, membrane anchor subunit